MKVDGAWSPPGDACSSTPQGSMIKPLLFLVYINGLTEFLNENHLIFAPDGVKNCYAQVEELWSSNIELDISVGHAFICQKEPLHKSRK